MGTIYSPPSALDTIYYFVFFSFCLRLPTCFFPFDVPHTSERNLEPLKKCTIVPSVYQLPITTPPVRAPHHRPYDLNMINFNVAQTIEAVQTQCVLNLGRRTHTATTNTRQSCTATYQLSPEEKPPLPGDIEYFWMQVSQMQVSARKRVRKNRTALAEDRNRLNEMTAQDLADFESTMRKIRVAGGVLLDKKSTT